MYVYFVYSRFETLIGTSGEYLLEIQIYYTLRFYFPYLSLLAQPVNITLYGLPRFRFGSGTVPALSF